jgi:predicted DNA-binding transcriptional regulator AlpA
MHEAPLATESFALPSNKITRLQLASLLALSLRTVDEYTRRGIFPHYKIGKSVRYDVSEIQVVLTERYHVRAKARKTHAKG